MQKNKLSIKRAVKLIALSTLFISGSVTWGLLYYFHVQEVRLNDERYTITTIAHIGNHEAPLPTSYLADILDLSGSKKHNLFAFNIEKAKEKLLASPVIESVELREMPPSTLGIAYIVKEPRLVLQDMENTAIDAKGFLLPIKPFFVCETLPKIVLGIDATAYSWGDRVETKELEAAFEVLFEVQKLAQGPALEVWQVDVSKWHAKSYGKRQISLHLKDEAKEWLLRLGSENYKEQLHNFLRLRKYLQKQTNGDLALVVDLRVSGLGFIHPLNSNERNGIQEDQKES